MFLCLFLELLKILVYQGLLAEVCNHRLLCKLGVFWLFTLAWLFWLPGLSGILASLRGLTFVVTLVNLFMARLILHFIEISWSVNYFIIRENLPAVIFQTILEQLIWLLRWLLLLVNPFDHIAVDDFGLICWIVWLYLLGGLLF